MVAFICCALMTSLFVFHSSHKQSLTILADGQGTLFPYAREIKSFELVSAENKKFTQKDLLHHWSLVFFGFTHCSTICPVTLGMLGKSYDQLHAIYPNLQVVFISLDPLRDNVGALSHFTHTYHRDFIGVSGKIQEIRKLQSQLGIFSAQDPMSSNDNYQLQHSSSILLFNPEGKWAGMFKYGMTAEQFSTAFTESMQHV